MRKHTQTVTKTENNTPYTRIYLKRIALNDIIMYLTT